MDNGAQSIEAYLASKGVDVQSDDNWIFRRVSDVSSDGRVIVGQGGTDTAADTEVVDNLDSGFDVGWDDGDSSKPHNWSISSDPTDGYNGDYHYAPPGDGHQIATWTYKPTIFERRPCELFASWTSTDNRAKNATYTIYAAIESSDGLNEEYEIETVQVEQTINGGKFNSLGVFSGYHITKVVLKDNASGHVVADAVKKVYLDHGWVATIDDKPNAPDNLIIVPKIAD